MTRVKIVDVAERAKVSKSTISQYLNGRFHHMSNATKERIEQAIKELNYVPSPIARSLKSDRTYIIGVIVRDISGVNTGQILRGIDDYCKKNGYNVIIYNTDFDEASERHALQRLKQLRVDGLILTSTGKNSDVIHEFCESGFPMVQFQLEYKGDCLSTVRSNDRESAYQATEYLIERGHRHIGFITQDFLGNLARTDRFDGYVEALAAHHIPFNESLVHYWDRQNGFRTSPLSLIKTHQVTAFFTQHLAITLDLLQRLNRHHIRIPDDVSLIGFDDVPMVNLLKVPITVVRQNLYRLGETSAMQLLKILQGERNAPKTIVIPCTFIERDSCRTIEHKEPLCF